MVKYPKGFSLIELLVALAIMSMTLLISSLGYSFFMDRWQKSLGIFDQSANTAKKLLLTKHSILGIYPYILRDKNHVASIYFEGNEDGFIGITTRSFFYRDTPSVVRFSLMQQEDFTYQLHYEEEPIAKNPITIIKQNINFKRRVVLLDGILDVKFHYYGHKNLSSKVAGSENKVWWQSFNGFNRKILPDAIRLSFVYHDKQETIEIPLSQVDTRILALFDDNF
ncbi:MAG: prepilin-type N-terminal cleavage/methylation domain-containing protein [Thalassotalea sp.]|nr:prepilin-type N-terminal cleavage/methylation domain-containing protein [Thalassotalea sp.]